MDACLSLVDLGFVAFAADLSSAGAAIVAVNAVNKNLRLVTE